MFSVTTADAGVSGAGPTAAPRWSDRAARPSRDTMLAIALAAGLIALALISSGGVDNELASAGNTWTQIAVTVLGAVAVGALLIAGPRGPRWGMATVGWMAALTALGALSIAWSYLPDASWLASGQAVAYLAAFAGAVCVARLAPGHWPALLGGVAIAMTALCGWSLLVKVFPSTLASTNVSGRLQAPFGYWNAIGLCAAIGLPACLWAGARRNRGRLVAGFAAPALSLMVSVDILSYSRSADAAAALAAALWLAFAPVRLRSIAMLAIGAVGGAVIGAWMLSHEALKGDNVSVAAQDHAGHTFGIVIIVVLLVVTAAGLVAARAMDRVTVSEALRRRIGSALIGLVVLAVLAAIGAVAASSRGLTGQISHAWHELVSPNSVVSATAANRVLQFGSSRPVYWHQALQVGLHHLFKGVGLLGFGVARLRYTPSPEVISEAHGYVFEVFADLGLVGVAVTFALLVSWLIAAARPLTVRLRSSALGTSLAAEREGMIALAAIVVAFGLQSTLDWTWFFAGIAVPVLLCAGWLAGRGPLRASPGDAPAPAAPGSPGDAPASAVPGSTAAGAPASAVPASPGGTAARGPGQAGAGSRMAADAAAGANVPDAPAPGASGPGRPSLLDRLAARPLAAAGLVALVVCTLAICWLQWRPLHSSQQLSASESDHTTAQAFPSARAAASSDPLSIFPPTWLAQLYARLGDLAQARAQLIHARTLQPKNPASSLALAQFDQAHGRIQDAISEYRRVLELDHSQDITAKYAVAGLAASKRAAASGGH